MPTSPLHSSHEESGTRFTDFGGWTMPIHHDSILEEHEAVRTDVGVFDVSHLGRFEVSGEGATDLLRSQLCNDIMKIGPGRAQYTMALNERGGIEDDIIVWWLHDEHFWVMPNGTNFDGIVERFRAAAGPSVNFDDVRERTALVAVQGVNALDVVEKVLGFAPRRFRVTVGEFAGHEATTAGTGYTGESGAEICVPIASAHELWAALLAEGAKPAALGARDTLRLEMGYPLWGQDLHESVTPLEAGLGWVVDWDHDFVGKAALEAIRDDLPSKLVAFVTEGRAIPRTGYPVTTETGSGEVTSGNFSPTLGHGIGMAYVSPPPGTDEKMTVTIRNKEIPARIVSLPFIEK
jgi:aminomethyltransferase